MTSTMKTPSTDTPIQVVRSESDRPQVKRERRRNLGGARLKLEVIGTIPGHHLYWANDDEGEIEQLLDQGFELVTQKELNQRRDTVVADSDVAANITRHVGTKADGSPLRAMLMKCTDEIWAEIQEDNRDAADQWDHAIKAGKIQEDTSRYTPKRVTNSIDTKFRKEY